MIIGLTKEDFQFGKNGIHIARCIPLQDGDIITFPEEITVELNKGGETQNAVQIETIVPKPVAVKKATKKTYHFGQHSFPRHTYEQIRNIKWTILSVIKSFTGFGAKRELTVKQILHQLNIEPTISVDFSKKTLYVWLSEMIKEGTIRHGRSRNSYIYANHDIHSLLIKQSS